MENRIFREMQDSHWGRRESGGKRARFLGSRGRRARSWTAGSERVDMLGLQFLFSGCLIYSHFILSLQAIPLASVWTVGGVEVTHTVTAVLVSELRADWTPGMGMRGGWWVREPEGSGLCFPRCRPGSERERDGTWRNPGGINRKWLAWEGHRRLGQRRFRAAPRRWFWGESLPS